VSLAFLRGRHIYFVKENKFWIFSPASRPPISKPMLLPKELAGVTHGITLPGNRTFLFTSNQYWRLLPGSIAVDEYANPGYPRRTRDWWWKCRNSQSMRELRNRNGLAEGLRNRDSRIVMGELRARSDSKTVFPPFHLNLILLSSLVIISSSCK